MTDTDRNPDSPPADRPADIERAVGEDRGNRDITNVQEDDETALEPTVSPDSAGGAGGVVRNQDEDAQ